VLCLVLTSQECYSIVCEHGPWLLFVLMASVVFTQFIVHWKNAGSVNIPYLYPGDPWESCNAVWDTSCPIWDSSWFHSAQRPHFIFFLMVASRCIRYHELLLLFVVVVVCYSDLLKRTVYFTRGWPVEAETCCEVNRRIWNKKLLRLMVHPKTSHSAWY
jgi:hypothetical protein